MKSFLSLLLLVGSSSSLSFFAASPIPPPSSTTTMFAHAALNDAEQTAWNALVADTNGDMWKACGNPDACSCSSGKRIKVKCTENSDDGVDTIVSIALPQNNLNGTLSMNSFAPFTSLTTLVLNGNPDLVATACLNVTTASTVLLDEENVITCQSTQAPTAPTMNPSIAPTTAAQLAFSNFFDGSNGMEWNRCNGNRDDPCSCGSKKRKKQRISCSADGVPTTIVLQSNNVQFAEASEADQLITALLEDTGATLLDLVGNTELLPMGEPCLDIAACMDEGGNSICLFPEGIDCSTTEVPMTTSFAPTTMETAPEEGGGGGGGDGTTTEAPTAAVTIAPQTTNVPTLAPTTGETATTTTTEPTVMPTAMGSVDPTSSPTSTPTLTPTMLPTSVSQDAWSIFFNDLGGRKWTKGKNNRDTPCELSSGRTAKVLCGDVADDSPITSIVLKKNNLIGVFPLGTIQSLIEKGLTNIDLTGNKGMVPGTCIPDGLCDTGEVTCKFDRQIMYCRDTETPTTTPSASPTTLSPTVAPTGTTESPTMAPVSTSIENWIPFFDDSNGKKWKKCKEDRLTPCSCKFGKVIKVKCDKRTKSIINTIGLKKNGLNGTLNADAVNMMIGAGLTKIDVSGNPNLSMDGDCVDIPKCNDAKVSGVICKFDPSIKLCEDATPSASPSMAPTPLETTSEPTSAPSMSPSIPSTSSPTMMPTMTSVTTAPFGTVDPTISPTISPSAAPTPSGDNTPSAAPTMMENTISPTAIEPPPQPTASPSSAHELSSLSFCRTSMIATIVAVAMFAFGS